MGKSAVCVGGSMRIERRFTSAGQDPFHGIAFKSTTSEIRNPDGSRVFHLPDIEVPAEWSQVASDILAQKYFRKAGLPAKLKAVEEKGVPAWLWRKKPDEKALDKLPAERRSEGERRSAGSLSSAFSSGFLRHSQAGTPFSSTAFSLAGSPALRKYFCARISLATWLHSAGTSISGR